MVNGSLFLVQECTLSQDVDCLETKFDAKFAAMALHYTLRENSWFGVYENFHPNFDSFPK